MNNGDNNKDNNTNEKTHITQQNNNEIKIKATINILIQILMS